jgi:hypothetical protein
VAAVARVHESKLTLEAAEPGLRVRWSFTRLAKSSPTPAEGTSVP